MKLSIFFAPINLLLTFRIMLQTSPHMPTPSIIEFISPHNQLSSIANDPSITDSLLHISPPMDDDIHSQSFHFAQSFNNTAISTNPVPTQPPQDHYLSAFMSANNTMLSNQAGLIEHLIKNNTKSPKPPSSSDFPVLSNKETSRDTFSMWYFKVISILATHDWNALYDPSTYDVIKNGHIHPELINHLYSALLNHCKEQPQALITNLRHLWSNGIALLRQLRKTYYGQLTNVEAIRLQGELLSPRWSHKPDETIDNFAARTMAVQRDLAEHGILIDNNITKQCFIMGLGPDFAKIQEDLQWDRLHPEWTTNDIVNLVEPPQKVLRISLNLRVRVRVRV